MNKEEKIEDSREILAEERTLEAKQRTVLSFIRTGVALTGMGLISLKVFGEMWIRPVGMALVVLGMYLILHYWRVASNLTRNIERVEKDVDEKAQSEFIRDRENGNHPSVIEKIKRLVSR